MSRRAADPRSRVADALRRSIGGLSTAATSRMAEDLPWFRELSAEDRSWVGMILQAGIRGFVDWFEQGGDSERHRPSPRSVFGAAPRALAGVITLQQTVDLVKLSIEVVESNVEDIVAAEDAAEVRRAISRYAREVAFATAEVYARAAEVRGAWDARLEALVVDAVLRAETDEAVLSRASALGWKARGTVCVVLGASPARRTETDLFDDVRRTAAAAGMDALCAVQGDRLVVLLGGVAEPRQAASVIAGLFGDGPVVAGPVATDLAGGAGSARAAVSALPLRARVAGGPAPGAGLGAARRARPRWRRPRPAAAGRRRLPPAAARPRRSRGDPHSVARSWLVDRGGGAGAVRAPEHGPLPPPPGRGPDRPHPGPGPRRVHAPDRAGAGPPVRPRLTPSRRKKWE